MPHDFEMYGDINREFAKIGQNVPSRTAFWIVSQAIKHMYDKSDGPRVRVFSNIKQQEQTSQFYHERL